MKIIQWEAEDLFLRLKYLIKENDVKPEGIGKLSIMAIVQMKPKELLSYYVSNSSPQVIKMMSGKSQRVFREKFDSFCYSPTKKGVYVFEEDFHSHLNKVLGLLNNEFYEKGTIEYLISMLARDERIDDIGVSVIKGARSYSNDSTRRKNAGQRCFKPFLEYNKIFSELNSKLTQ